MSVFGQLVCAYLAPLVGMVYWPLKLCGVEYTFLTGLWKFVTAWWRDEATR